MSENKILFLNSAAVEQSLSMPEAILAMRSAFSQLSDGRAAAPLRSYLKLPGEGNGALFMPVYLPAENMVALKQVMIHRDNPALGLPMIQAMVTVMDATTGRPVAIMDGEKLTALRTGAASGLATDLLARKDAGTVAVFGAGVQGRSQLAAVVAVRTIQKAIIFDPDAAKAEEFAREMAAQLQIKVQPAKEMNEISQADVICCATSAVRPVFPAPLVKPGTHINGVGSYRPDMQEIPPQILANAKIVVDQRSAALSEAGDIIQAMEGGLIDASNIHGELGEICLKRISARVSAREITVFKSVGNAVQDLAAAAVVIQNARANNIGQYLQL